MLRKFILWSFISLFSMLTYATTITIRIANPIKSVPTLYLPDGDEFPIKVDKQGQGMITFQVQQAGYIKVGYNYATRLFWVDPTSTLQLSFKGDEFYKQIDIKGDNLAINNYLNQTSFTVAQINDTEMKEAAFLQKSESLLNAILSNLNQSKLSASFKDIEAKRSLYLAYQALPSYPEFHKRITKDNTYKPSQNYWNKLKEVAVFNGNLLVMEDYQSFIIEATRELARKEFPALKGINRLTAYIDKYVNDTRVAEFLIYRNVYAHVQSKGLDDKNYENAFKKYVKSPKLVKNFNALCTQFNNLGKGSLSADFNATDITGKKVSLKDLRGKYVYIDIWATWCVPCRKEMPHLLKLEEKYKNADINFVSISCDTNRKAWEKMVTTKNMKGIQLHFSDNSFMKKYMIEGVPHFILLDKEGKIVSADMTRPSDPATTALFEKLLK